MRKCTEKGISKGNKYRLCQRKFGFSDRERNGQNYLEYNWRQKIEGKEKFTEELEKMKTKKASELTLDRILTHGKEGAVSRIMKMQNGKKYAFSDFYEFSGAKGAKLKSIISYVIGI